MITITSPRITSMEAMRDRAAIASTSAPTRGTAAARAGA
jgi:hypothetical protein